MKKKISCLVLIVFLLLGLAGCGKAEKSETLETVPTTLPEVTEPMTQPQMETLAELPSTEPEPLVLYSGLREDGSFDKGTLFIGDSQTYLFIEQHLKINDLLGDAKYIAQCGSQLTAFWSDTIRPTEDKSVYSAVSPEFEGMTFREAAAQMGAEATAIYLMWGSNYTPDATAESYVQIVDCLLEICPYATIHLQTIPYGDVAYIEVNQRISGAYEHYQSIGEPRVMLVDTFTAIGRCISSDRVHVSGAGREAWYDALVSHAKENGLSQ